MCSSYNDKYMIKEGEYIDEIGFGGLRLIQKTSNFRYGLDAVPIADMAENALSPCHLPEDYLWLSSRVIRQE